MMNDSRVKYHYAYIHRIEVGANDPHVIIDYVFAESRDQAIAALQSMDIRPGGQYLPLVVTNDPSLDELSYGIDNQTTRWQKLREFGCHPEASRRRDGEIYGDRKYLKPECFVEIPNFCGMDPDEGPTTKYSHVDTWDAVRAMCDPMYGQRKGAP